MESLQVNLGNTVTFRDRPGAAYVALTGRPNAAGTAVIAAPTLTAKNFGSIFQSRTTGALQVIHGTVGGNIVQIDAPATQIGQPADADLNGVAGLSLPLGFKRVSGNDELVFTVK
jgi:hypothetical protein